MHAALFVIHNEHSDIDDLLRKFDECNEDYYTFDYDEDYIVPVDEITKQEAEEDGMVLDDTGEFYGYLGNPDGRYDWYEIGGRYEGLLPLKNGKFANTARISDIDIDRLENPPYYYDEAEDEWHDTCMPILQPASQEQTEAFRSFIRSYDQNAMITIVDIHY